MAWQLNSIPKLFYSFNFIFTHNLNTSFLETNVIQLFCSCRVGGAYPQIVFGSTGDGGCRYKITSQNWQEYLQFDVAARIDFRADGNRANLVTLVLTKEKNGKVFETKILCQVR